LDRRVDAGAELLRDVADGVVVVHGGGGVGEEAPPVHEDQRCPRLRGQTQHSRLTLPGGDVVDDGRTGIEGRAGHGLPHRVHTDAGPVAGQFADHGEHAGELLLLGDACGAGARRFPADVDDVCPALQQVDAVGDRVRVREPTTAVGEGGRGDVEDPHDLRARPVHGHHLLRMRLIASERDAASRSWPRTADVIVEEPGFCTPRIDMHRCSASTTTIAPRGCRCVTSASAICVVRRSCTCGRRAKTSTSRASFDSPVTRPSTPGMYPMCATPWNGTRWCSHVEYSAMSRTSTISSNPMSNWTPRMSPASCARPMKASS